MVIVVVTPETGEITKLGAVIEEAAVKNPLNDTLVKFKVLGNPVVMLPVFDTKRGCVALVGRAEGKVNV